jgi:Putative prokaryotic signal transducing protein
MAGKLVTIARFDLAGQAHIAKNALEAVGIKSVLADEQTVAMDWLLSNAIGGIKVQVLEEDAERAVTALEVSLGSDEPVDEDTMAAEAEAAEKEEIGELSEPAAPQAHAPPTPAGIGTEEGLAGKPSERDDYARRLFLTSVFAVVVPPLWFYAIYLFLNAAFGEGPISERGRTKLIHGGAILSVGLLLLFALMLVYWALYG